MIHFHDWASNNPCKNWNIYIKTFRSPRRFNILLDLFDMQGDGLILLTIGINYRSIQFQMPFPGDKIKTRLEWSLFSRTPPPRYCK